MTHVILSRADSAAGRAGDGWLRGGGDQLFGTERACALYEDFVSQKVKDRLRIKKKKKKVEKQIERQLTLNIN